MITLKKTLTQLLLFDSNFFYTYLTMPYIPATRQRTLKRPQEDLIQWAIIEPRYKKPSLAYDDSTQSITTLDIAKRFILLLRGNSNQVTAPRKTNLF
jgi:hypothetical protein